MIYEYDYAKPLTSAIIDKQLQEKLFCTRKIELVIFCYMSHRNEMWVDGVVLT